MTHLEEQALKDNFHGQYDNGADNGECWMWCGSRDGVGFPVAYIDNNRYPAQRVAYAIGEGVELSKLDGETVEPTCFNPLDCVNPSHLKTSSWLDGFEEWFEKVTAHLRSE